MTNTELIKEILSDKALQEKYEITESDLSNIAGDSRYQKKVVQLVKEIIDDHSNHHTATISYNRIKNMLNI